ncbi:MAG TPA: helix-turn-helix domain-containing protein [Acidimicrobiales bacterium]|nr:helix-turn-helix domain-containing protein [Acidimicrobiales bacterium]
MTPPDRTYGQYCPIAAGLDLVGDRWTLLICRELAQGDRRYTDLKAALDGIAPNLLCDRLRTLQEVGLVTTAELPPPAARSIYRLTEDGRRIIPVLRAMARFGIKYLDGEPEEEMSAARTANALLLPWRRPIDVDLRVRLAVGDSSVDIALDGRDTRVEPTEGDADVVITTDSTSIVRARQGEPLDSVISGSRAAKKQFLEAFALTPS